MKKPPLLKSLKLKEIEIADLQARAATDDKTIAEYAEAYKDGAKFPAAVVFHDGKTYFLADGFHRYFGAKEAGFTDLLCDVREGTRKDALWFSIGANKTHGLKRSNADKRNAVQMALQERPEMTDNAIASYIGVSNHLVSDFRKPVSTTVKQVGEFQPEKRTGADGKHYPATKLPPVPVVKSPPPEPEKPKSPPVVAPKSSPPIVIPEQVKDRTGRNIPKAILPIYEREHEVKSMMGAISNVRSALRKAQEDKDVMYVRTNFSSILAQLDNAYVELKTALPFVLCTACQGSGGEECGLCKGKGFISEFLWNTAVTKETKELLERVKK
jgi:hypothetical protein